MIEQHRIEIEHRWLEWVQVDLAFQNQKKVTPSELRDSIGDYLLRIADALRMPSSSSNEQRGSDAWFEVTKEHAVTRVRLGFDIDQLVHEFILLRRVLVEFARKDGLLANPQQTEDLTDLIEASVKVAVRSYVESRDYEFRRIEAEHISFVTHELRNPLTIATMAASEISRKFPKSEKSDKLLELLATSLQRLKELIDTVLLSERLQIKKVEVLPVDTLLGVILERSLQSARATAQHKGLKLRLIAHEQIPLHVDVELTVSAVQNLVDNAVKYTDSGQINVNVEDTQNEELIFHVRDMCGGIPKKELKLLFEPFRRGHSGKPGTGLGLAIARQAVELQGGQIDVESLEGEGCHFWIRLPKNVKRKEFH